MHITSNVLVKPIKDDSFMMKVLCNLHVGHIVLVDITFCRAVISTILCPVSNVEDDIVVGDRVVDDEGRNEVGDGVVGDRVVEEGCIVVGDGVDDDEGCNVVGDREV